MSRGELIRDTHGGGPLCPMSMGALSGEHRAERIFDDLMHNAFKPLRSNDTGQPDPEGDLPPDLDKAYSAVIYSPTYSRMHLHKEGTTFMEGRTIIDVEAYYWRCHLCGHTIPATTIKRTP